MFYGALLLTGANLALRMAGMSFQVYLSGRVGAAGVGLLQLILSVKMLAFTVGSAGARTCALYLSAEALGRRRSVRPALSGCVWYCLRDSGPSPPGLPPAGLETPPERTLSGPLPSSSPPPAWGA